MRLEKGFTPLIIIVITTLIIGAGIGGFLVFWEKKTPSLQKAVPQESLETVASGEESEVTVEEEPKIESIVTDGSKQIQLLQSSPQPSRPQLPPQQQQWQPVQQQPQEPRLAERVRWEFRYQWEPSGTPPQCPENLIKVTPADMNQVTSILYPGQYRGDHYKAHGGFGFESSNPNNVTVRIPQDGFIVGGVRYYEVDELQYLFDIEHPCGIRFRFDHLRVLSPQFQKIAETLPPPKIDDTRGTRLSVPVEVKAGEVIATGVAFEHTPNTLTGFDFGMYDLRKINNKAATDSAWKAQYWGDQAPYALCWLDLLPEPDRSRAKSLPAPGGNFEIQSDYCK